MLRCVARVRLGLGLGLARVWVWVGVRVRVRVCDNSIISIKNGEGFRRGRILFNNCPNNMNNMGLERCGLKKSSYDRVGVGVLELGVLYC